MASGWAISKLLDNFCRYASIYTEPANWKTIP